MAVAAKEKKTNALYCIDVYGSSNNIRTSLPKDFWILKKTYQLQLFNKAYFLHKLVRYLRKSIMVGR